MKIRSKKIIYISVISFVGSIVLIVVAGIYLTHYLERKVAEKLFANHGKAASIKVDLLTQSLKFTDVEWNSLNDSLNKKQHSIKARSIALHRFSLYQLALNKSIHFKDLIIDSGYLEFDKTKDTIKQKAFNSPYKSLRFQNIHLNTVEIRIKTDTMTNASARIRGEIINFNVKLDTINKLSYSAKEVELSIEKVDLSRYEGMYSSTVARILISTANHNIEIDSILLIPNYDKYEFAQHKGEQIARMNCSIPQITIHGLQFEKIFDRTFIASKIEILSFDIYSFKDKRLPFLRKRSIPLPMESFLKLPWTIQVDSTIITNSHITIEEFPEEGVVSGTVSFDDVNAILSGLNNRAEKKDAPYALLTASSQFMGTAKIKAAFLLPLDGKSIYKAGGSISQLPFTQLNPMLKMVNLRVESGQLNNLTFDFNYTDSSSQGTLGIDYENLRFLALDKNKKSTNEFKTMLANVFVKNNINQSKSPLKRMGVIDVERNKNRYIFNLWMISLLDGLKSGMTGNTTKKL
ncbi:MAG: hypothetical protein ABL895_08520 [Cyclobacteriaceae bacterium]